MRKGIAFFVIIAALLFNAAQVFGEGISVSSENGDNIRLFEDITTTEPVKGNIVTVLGDVTVNSNINGQVVAVFGDVDINAEVSGQVVTIFGNTHISEGAVVRGNVITIGSLTKDDGASLLGQEVRIFGEAMNIDIGAIIYLRLAIMILFTLAVLIIGLLLLRISTKKYYKMAENIDKNIGKKLLLGVLSFLAASILLILLLVTLICPIVYIVLLVLSTITASMFFGRVLLRTFSSQNSIYVEFITGLISITLIKLLLLFLIPQTDILLGFGLVSLLDIFIYSVGLGIYMEARYIKGK